jgi:hypothetical protein
LTKVGKKGAYRPILDPPQIMLYGTNIGREQIATTAPGHKAKHLVNIHLCDFAFWWRKFLAMIGTGFAIKGLKSKFIYR